MQAFHGSSPLTRGAPVTGGILQVLNRLIPAYAGSTRCSCCFLRVEWAHPRLRGEHSYFSWMVGVIFGSSPLTRGARRFNRILDVGRGLIPAYAGSTTGGSLSATGCTAHPRLRGEHALPVQVKTLTGGSSPLTRGAHRDSRDRGALIGLIPAYAGSTRPRLHESARRPAHPRLRGEHVFSVASHPPLVGSSPLTRGAQARASSARCSSRLIPAYAGSTTRMAIGAFSRGAHPRLRGEHF